MDRVNDSEFCQENFCFSNTLPWQLYSPQRRGSRCWNVAYVVWRVVSALFFLGSIIVTGVEPWFDDGATRVKWFIFLTNWSFLIITVFQLWSGGVTLYKYYTMGLFWLEEDEGFAWYLKVTWALQELAYALALTTAVMFWGIIYTPGYVLEYSIIVAHGVNAVWVVLDLAISAVPVRALHGYLPASVTLIYGVFSLVYEYAGGTNYYGKPFIYEHASWRENPGKMAFFWAGVVFTCILLHLLLTGLYKLKVSICEGGSGDSAENPEEGRRPLKE